MQSRNPDDGSFPAAVFTSDKCGSHTVALAGGFRCRKCAVHCAAASCPCPFPETRIQTKENLEQTKKSIKHTKRLCIVFVVYHLFARLSPIPHAFHGNALKLSALILERCVYRDAGGLVVLQPGMRDQSAFIVLLRRSRRDLLHEIFSTSPHSRCHTITKTNETQLMTATTLEIYSVAFFLISTHTIENIQSLFRLCVYRGIATEKRMQARA